VFKLPRNFIKTTSTTTISYVFIFQIAFLIVLCLSHCTVNRQPVDKNRVVSELVATFIWRECRTLCLPRTAWPFNKFVNAIFSSFCWLCWISTGVGVSREEMTIYSVVVPPSQFTLVHFWIWQKSGSFDLVFFLNGI